MACTLSLLSDLRHAGSPQCLRAFHLDATGISHHEGTPPYERFAPVDRAATLHEIPWHVGHGTCPGEDDIRWKRHSSPPANPAAKTAAKDKDSAHAIYARGGPALVLRRRGASVPKAAAGRVRAQGSGRARACWRAVSSVLTHTTQSKSTKL